MQVPSCKVRAVVTSDSYCPWADTGQAGRTWVPPGDKSPALVLPASLGSCSLLPLQLGFWKTSHPQLVCFHCKVSLNPPCHCCLQL